MSKWDTTGLDEDKKPRLDYKNRDQLSDELKISLTLWCLPKEVWEPYQMVRFQDLLMLGCIQTLKWRTLWIKLALPSD